MKLLNEWYPTGTFRKVVTPFWTDSTCEKILMAAVPIKDISLPNTEIEYNDNFGHTIGRIQHISIMRYFYIFLYSLSPRNPNNST